MTKKEKQFVAMLLKMASSKFANHCCNDLPKEIESFFTKEEWLDLDKKYHRHNEHTDTPQESHHVNADFAWMSYFANVLNNEK